MSGGYRPAPIRLLLVTGARGSGKTTLINAAQDRPALAGLRVLINETGRTPLAPALALAVPEADAAMAAGCLCCTGRHALASALEGILRAIDNHRLPPVPHLILETAGDADPVALAVSVTAHPYLSRRFCLAGIVTLLDPRTIEPANAILTQQVAAADLLVFAQPPDAKAEAWLADLAPATPRILREPLDRAVEHLAGLAPMPPSDKPEDVRRAMYRQAMHPPR